MLVAGSFLARLVLEVSAFYFYFFLLEFGGLIR
jgi:hypothetical protein